MSVSKEDFARVVECFMGELSAIRVLQTVDKLRQYPSFYGEFRESATLLRDPSTADDQILGLACGLVDEFVHAARDRVIDEAFAFYSDQSSGKS